MSSQRKKAANIAKAKYKGQSSMTDVLSIRVPKGLTREQRSEARRVAQECVENWNTLRKMYGEVKS